MTEGRISSEQEEKQGVKKHEWESSELISQKIQRQLREAFPSHSVDETSTDRMYYHIKRHSKYDFTREQTTY